MFRLAFRNPRFVAAAVVALGGLAIYAVNFPGSMEYDSFVQLVEARAKSYANWHPAVMSWLIGISDALPGPVAAWLVGFDMLLAFGALAALLWLPKKASWAAAPVAAAMLMLPQLSLNQAVVWKDVLFADAAVAAYVCLAFAAAKWERQTLRNGLIAAAAGLLALAVLTRQNGVMVVPGAVAALVMTGARYAGWRTALIKGAGLLGLTALIALGADSLLQLRADDYPGRQEQIKRLQVYDLAGILHRRPDAPLTVLERARPTLANLLRAEAKTLWSPVKNDTLETDAMVAEIEATPAPLLTRQWAALIARHPGQYAAERLILFRWLVQPPDAGLCQPFHVGDEGDPADLKALGMAVRMTPRDEALADYGFFFLRHTPVFRHGLFGLAGLVVMFILLRRRAAADIVLASLIGSAFLFAATFLVLSLACDYRYLTLIDLSALAGVLYLAADWRRLLRR